MTGLLRKVLLSLMLVGAIGSSLAAGTFASFNASSTTASTTFSTGTLVLGNQVGPDPTVVATCLSTGSQIPVGSTQPATNTIAGSQATNDHQCASLLDQPDAKKNQDYAIDVTLTNLGDLPGTLSARLDDCSAAMCSTVYVSVATFASAVDRQNGIVQQCVYGTNCTTAPLDQTLADLDAAGGVSIGPMARGAVVYLRVWVYLESGDNGTYISPSFVWELAQ